MNTSIATSTTRRPAGQSLLVLVGWWALTFLAAATGVFVSTGGWYAGRVKPAWNLRSGKWMLDPLRRVSALFALVLLLCAGGCEDEDNSLAPGDPAAARRRIRFPVVVSTMNAIPPAAEASVEDLTAYIRDHFDNPLERAYAAYHWVRVHIRDDDKQLGTGTIDPETQLATTVFSTRLAVCEGYARVYAWLLESMGISAAHIRGYGVMKFYEPGTPHSSYEHVWNGVEVEGRWYLVDASWNTSARLDGSSDPAFFFFADPARFVVRHYPHDSEWQLLSPAVTEERFWAGLMR